MNAMIHLKVMGEEKKVVEGTVLQQLADEYEHEMASPIILAVVNGKLSELHNKVKADSDVQFLDIMNKDGFRTYQRSLSFLLIKAAHDVFGHHEDIKVIVQFSINNGFYCEIEPRELLNEKSLVDIKNRMDEMIKAEVPFEKVTVKTDEAIRIFDQQNMEDKVHLFKYRRVSNVNLYSIQGFYDYFYGYMAPHTGYLKQYDLFLHSEGLVLQFFDRGAHGKITKYEPDKMLFDSLKRSTDWGRLMSMNNVADLNDSISTGEMKEMILVQEALMEKQIGMIADRIMEDIDNKKFVFIAGPSSSGKTTFAHRLSVQLRSQGLRPHPISVDNYFVRRELTPKDKNGDFDFECLEAIDVKMFNRDMVQLLSGETVDMPTFDFVKGYQVFNGNLITLGEKDILVIEGIHGLNPKMSYSIPEENKFKVYISALTQLNIDNHNRVPTTDARLLRRIVRDNQYRGTKAERTISMWPSVRRGEEIHIFPFQEEADVMFNSALIYELSVLKQYAEPLLFNVPRESKEYIEAKRLIKFLDYFLGITSESIPDNSLIREFIGGSNFRK